MRRYITIPVEPELFDAIEKLSKSLRLTKSALIRLLLIRELSTSYLTLQEKKAIKVLERPQIKEDSEERI